MGWQPTAQVPQVIHSWTALAGLIKQGKSTHHAVWTRCWLRSHSNTWRYITIIWKIWVRQLLTKTWRAQNSDLGVHAAKEPQAIPQELLVMSGRQLNFWDVLATCFYSWAECICEDQSAPVAWKALFSMWLIFILADNTFPALHIPVPQ